MDSTGLKVYGEGEWKVRQHGVSKRRTWRKLHVGANPEDGEIQAVLLTENSASDDNAVEALLSQIWKHGNTKAERLKRDPNLRSIRKHGRKERLPNCLNLTDGFCQLSDLCTKAITNYNLPNENLRLRLSPS